jgi:hypothetical protein
MCDFLLWICGSYYVDYEKANIICCIAVNFAESSSFRNNSSPPSNGRRINQEGNQRKLVESGAKVNAILSSEASGFHRNIMRPI